MSSFYVYEHWRLDRDECFYVGKGQGKRAYNMTKRNSHHKAIQSKLIGIGLSVEIRIVADGLNERDAFDLEIARIAFWRDAGACLTNYTNGGQGASGHSPSEETRRKRAVYMSGRTLSEETRRKISAAHKGRTAHNRGQKLSAQHRAKLSAAKLGKRRPADICAKISASLVGNTRSLGRTLTAEHRAKIGAKSAGNLHRLGTMQSEDARAKISVGMRRVWEERKLAQGGEVTDAES